jgi:hypothetical protein
LGKASIFGESGCRLSSPPLAAEKVTFATFGPPPNYFSISQATGARFASPLPAQNAALTGLATGHLGIELNFPPELKL